MKLSDATIWLNSNMRANRWFKRFSTSERAYYIVAIEGGWMCLQTWDKGKLTKEDFQYSYPIESFKMGAMYEEIIIQDEPFAEVLPELRAKQERKAEQESKPTNIKQIEIAPAPTLHTGKKELTDKQKKLKQAGLF